MKGFRQVVAVFLALDFAFFAPAVSFISINAHADDELIERLIDKGVPHSVARAFSELFDKMNRALEAAQPEERSEIYRRYVGTFEAAVEALLGENQNQQAQRDRPIESVGQRNLRMFLGFQALQDAQAAQDPERLVEAVRAINGGNSGVLQISDSPVEVDLNTFRERVSGETLRVLVETLTGQIRAAGSKNSIDPMAFRMSTHSLSLTLTEGLKHARPAEFRGVTQDGRIVPVDAPLGRPEADIVVVEPSDGTEPVVESRPPSVRGSAIRFVFRVIRIVHPERKPGDPGLLDRFTMFVGKTTGAWVDAWDVYRAKLRAKRVEHAQKREIRRADRAQVREERNTQRTRDREREQRAREDALRERERSRQRTVHLDVYQHEGVPSPPSSVGVWFACGFVFLLHAVGGVALGIPFGFVAGMSPGLFGAYPSGALFLTGFAIPTLVGIGKGIAWCSRHLSDHKRNVDEYNQRRW